MKKYILKMCVFGALTLACATALTASAVTNLGDDLSGQGAYFINDISQLGVGTNILNGAVNVVGNVNVDGIITANNIGDATTINASNVSNGIFGANSTNGHYRFRSLNNSPILFTDATNARVGIGTETPETKLDVAGTINATEVLVNGSPVVTSSGGGGENLMVGNLRAGNVGHGLGWPGIGNDAIVNSGGNYAIIQNANGNTLINSSAGQSIGFRIANNQKMTLDKNGNLSVGNDFDVNVGVTNVFDDANSDAPYSRVSADSFHTNGLGVGQIWIEGYAIDSNSPIHIGAGLAGNQLPRNVVIGGNLDLAGSRIINVETPTAETDAATKQYVDDQVSAGGGKVVVESRTSDPANPQVGEIWLRTDL